MFNKEFIKEVVDLKEQLEEWEKRADKILTPENGNRARMTQYEVAMARYDVLHAIRSLKNFLRQTTDD